MITNFSGAFNLVDVNVTEHSGERVILPRDMWLELREGYPSFVPLLMKFENSYFPVYGEKAVPFETLALPIERDFVEDADTGYGQAFVVKPEYIEKMVSAI